MISHALRSPEVVKVLERLYAQVEREDGPAAERVAAREAELGRRLPQAERYALYGTAPLAISREVGELLYILARRAGSIVEFGASRGVSTIFLAAALRDSGSSRPLVTTELSAEKARIASRNLAEAGLDDLVEVRLGDALETLRNIDGGVQMLFLDGRNDLYLPVLELLAPQLQEDTLVVADLSADDPDLLEYLRHVRAPRNGYASVCVPLDAGVELSVRTGREERREPDLRRPSNTTAPAARARPAP